MLKAKLVSIRENKKGFSLIELIIVIAIMVALIAVMAPNFVKYIQKSHDAVLNAAAEDVLSFAKAEYAAGNLSGSGVIIICSAQESGESTKHITVQIESPYHDPATGKDITNTLMYGNEGEDMVGGDAGLANFKRAAGVDETKPCKSTDKYIIIIDETIAGHPVKMDEILGS